MVTYLENHSLIQITKLLDWFKYHFDLFLPFRHWLDSIEISNEKFARFICKLIPASCPFARTFTLGKFTVKIPPLCKLNPLYDEVVGLRFRALSYLADNEKP